jgi:hypothetical protein
LNAVQHTHHTDAISREADIEKYKPVNAEAWWWACNGILDCKLKL